MSIEQYQRAVASLDKEIADHEKKKAAFDGKAADARKKAANVSISKNASTSIVKSKMRQIESYNDAAIKADKESADLQKKIAEKRDKRNAAAQRLQKEESAERKRQDRATQQIMRSYESRIEEIHNMATFTVPFSSSRIVGDDEEQDMPETMFLYLMHGKTRVILWMNLLMSCEISALRFGTIPVKLNGETQ